MAHIYAFGDLCPKAKSFIHLGATSNFINDNVDTIIIKESLTTINDLLLALFTVLKDKSSGKIEQVCLIQYKEKVDDTIKYQKMTLL